MNNDRFRKVGGTSDNATWSPQATSKNGFQYDPNNYLEGYYTDMREGVGQNKQSVHTIQTINQDGSLGDTYDIWGDSVLNDRLGQVNLGSYIFVKYCGRQLKKGLPQQAWTQNNSYHIWDVGVDDNAVPYSNIVSGPAMASNAQAGQASRSTGVQNTQQRNGAGQFVGGQGNNQQQRQNGGAPTNRVGGQQGGNFNQPQGSAPSFQEDDLPF